MRLVAAVGSLLLCGCALVSATVPPAPSPRLSLTLHRSSPAQAGATDWSVETAASGQDADVYLMLRLDHTSTPAAVAVALCPSPDGVTAEGCVGVLRRRIDGAAQLAAGRIGTVAAGDVQRLRIEVAASGAGTAPRLAVNVTPCAVPRAADLWHRAATRPDKQGVPPLAGLDACSVRQPPWTLLGGVLIAGGIVVLLLSAAVRERG